MLGPRSVEYPAATRAGRCPELATVASKYKIPSKRPTLLLTLLQDDPQRFNGALQS